MFQTEDGSIYYSFKWVHFPFNHSWLPGFERPPPNTFGHHFLPAAEAAKTRIYFAMLESGQDEKDYLRDNMDEFTLQYFITALWSETDNADERGGEPLDSNYDINDFSVESMIRMMADCAVFQQMNAELIDEDPGLAGHDFWLTRNGHGAGFSDGDWDDEDPNTGRNIGDMLDESATRFGGRDIIVGDDGQLHCE